MFVELHHHGIKGQKWGVKNGPPYPIPYNKHSKSEKKANWQYSLNRNTNEKSPLKQVSDRTTQAGKLTISKKKTSKNANKASSKTSSPTKERIVSPFKKVGLMSSNGIHAKDIRPGRLFTTRPLGDEGIRISKGEIVQHIMATPTKDMTNRDYLFVAATEADKKNYAGFFAALTKYRYNADKMYSMEMTAMTDIVSPSKKERVDTFLEIYKEDPVKVATQLAEFNKRNYGDQFKESTEELVDKYSNMSMRELKNMGYYTYANSWFDPQAGTLKDMRSKLEDKGYNAIIDDNDKRSFVQSQAPLIVFDVMNNLGDIKVSELTNGEIRRNMIEWQNMKHLDIYSDELVHYGIKGMKWGVRRFQDKSGRLTKAGKERYSDEDESSDKKRGLTEKQKKYIKIGAIAAGTALAAYGGYKVYQAYTGKGYEIDSETGLRRLKKAYTDEEIVNRINPGKIRFLTPFNKNKEIIRGSSQNCMLCTTSYELQKRGYDVKAGFSTEGYTTDLFSKIYKDAPNTTKINIPLSYLDDYDNLKDLFSFTKQGEYIDRIKTTMSKEGDGARGNIMVWWKGNRGGHSMIWENINGTTRFMDGQTGKIYDDKSFKSLLFMASESRPVEFLRTDNLDINWDEMKNYINPNTTTKTYIDHGAEITARILTDPIVLGAGVGLVYNKGGTRDDKKQTNIG